MRKKWVFCALLTLFPSVLWADCMGEMRDTTEAEKALYDWVNIEFPKLFHTSSNYARDGNRIGASRNSRCVDGDGDPLYLSSYLTFALQGEAAEKQQMEILKLSDSYKALRRKTQERQQAGMAISEVIAKMEAENKQWKRKNQILQVRSRVTVNAYFNNSSAECRGETVTIPGALVACRWTSRDAGENLLILFGAWKRDNSGQGLYSGTHNLALPTHTLQGLEIKVMSTPEELAKIVEKTDWAGIEARVGK